MPESSIRIPELGQQIRMPDAGVSVSLRSAAGCMSGEQPKGVEDPPGEEAFFETAGGDTYRGMIDAKGKPHGYGLWTFAKGGNYEGFFKRNKRHGRGVMMYRDGSKYDGRWEDGQRHGAQGVFYSALDGLEYRGSWRKGKKHGKGEEFRRDEGIWYSVRYEKDELKERTPKPPWTWCAESGSAEHSRSSSSLSGVDGMSSLCPPQLFHESVSNGHVEDPPVVDPCFGTTKEMPSTKPDCRVLPDGNVTEAEQRSLRRRPEEGDIQDVLASSAFSPLLEHIMGYL